MQSVATQIARLESKLGLDQSYRGDGTPSVWRLHDALDKIEAYVFGIDDRTQDLHEIDAGVEVIAADGGGQA